jgi:lactoylglutathione lyase
MMKLGYTVFWVEDADQAARFYEQVFGLKRRFEMQTPLTPWIEMETGETALAFAQFSEAEVLFSGNFRKHDPHEAPVASVISFVTEDVEAVYKTAMKLGATSITAPKIEPWGQTIARIRDINGIAVSIATPLQPQA